MRVCVLCVFFMIVCSWLLVAVFEVLPSVFSPPPTTTICSRSRCELPREGWQRRQVSARDQTAAAPVLPKRQVQAVVVVVGYSSLFYSIVCCCFWPFFAKFVLFCCCCSFVCKFTIVFLFVVVDVALLLFFTELL